MSPRPVYAADREVIEACSARGVEVTPRQLERWRSFLPAREVERIDGVRGSRSSNPPGYVDQVIAITETLRAGIPLYEVPLVLFAREFPVRLDVLCGAYLDVFSRVARQFESFNAADTSGEVEPEDQVDAIAVHMAKHSRRNPMGQRWESRARQAVRSHQVEAANARSLLSSVLSAAFTGPLTGIPATAEGIAEALIVFGLNAGQDPQQLANHLATLNLNSITDAIRSATLEEWIAARDAVGGMLRYAEVRRRVEDRLPSADRELAGLGDFMSHDPVSRAMQIPALLIVANDEWRQSLHAELARWEALDSLISVLPEKFHQPLLQDQLSDDDRQGLVPLVKAWADEHPDEARLLNVRIE